MIHLYAFTHAGEPLPAVVGIGGGELETCALDGIAAVVSNVETGSGREAVVAHGLAVEALREAAPAVLPVRFGERFADRSALRADRAGRLETTGVEIDGLAGPRLHHAVFGASITALAVDDHAAGDDQSSRETLLVQGFQQHGSAVRYARAQLSARAWIAWMKMERTED